jgi:hypothetical protein
MICLRPSSSAAISSVVTAPSQLRSRSFATARIWSLTATAGCPSLQIGIRIGGLAFGELDSGTTITVLRLSFDTFTEITTQGRVLRISEPSAGSKATHQISPRSGITSTVLPAIWWKSCRLDLETSLEASRGRRDSDGLAPARIRCSEHEDGEVHHRHAGGNAQPRRQNRSSRRSVDPMLGAHNQ